MNAKKCVYYVAFCGCSLIYLITNPESPFYNLQFSCAYTESTKQFSTPWSIKRKNEYHMIMYFFMSKYGSSR